MKEIRIKIPTPEEVVPEEFKKHVLNASKETLLALRSLIDAGIKKLEEFESKKKELKKIEVS